MKWIFPAILCFCPFFFNCGNPNIEPGDSGSLKQDKIYYPYSATSDYIIGKGQHSKIIMDVWRAFEVGNLKQKSDFFAPEISLLFPDHHMSGKRDSILNLWQQRRNEYSSVQVRVDGWAPLYSKDLNENLVMIWGRLEMEDRNGKFVHKTILEKWGINGTGKIDYMQQFINAAYTQ